MRKVAKRSPVTRHQCGHVLVGRVGAVPKYVDDVSLTLRVPVALHDEKMVLPDDAGDAATHVAVERLQLVELFPGIAEPRAVDASA